MTELRLSVSPVDAAARILDILKPAGFAAARAAISQWPGYCATALQDLSGLAANLRVARIAYKDEGSRFGLGSFKALGGAYAVQRVSEASRGTNSRNTITVTTATAGNHGRAVAWGAQRFGCDAVIYIHEGVSVGREKAIAALGARVVRLPGSYDDSVRQCAADAQRNGWTVISDTSWAGYEETPRQVMYGYGVVSDEAIEQFGDPPPTHVFVQAGVGGLAASVCASLAHRWGDSAPRSIVVEPSGAACCFASAVAGRPSPAPTLKTIMGRLECGEVSPLAWSVLALGADAFMTVSDEQAIAAMRLLANPQRGDPIIRAGESAVAGLCGLIAACCDDQLRSSLALSDSSRVLLFGTEGPTDPDLYAKLIREPIGGEFDAV